MPGYMLPVADELPINEEIQVLGEPDVVQARRHVYAVINE